MPKTFPVKVQKIPEIFIFPRNFSSKRFSGCLESRYDDTAEIILPEVPNLLPELRKRIRIYFFKRKSFAQAPPLDT